MTTEDQGTLPTPQTPDEDPILSAGLGIAARWGAVLDAKQLEVALRGLEPQLRREHKERMFRLETQREAEERTFREKREERAHKRHLAGLVTGGIVAIAMLGASVFVAKDHWWLSILLSGPSMLALVKIFVLRRSDAYDMQSVSRAMRSAVGAAGQAPPPPPPPVV
ncbi:hypothetical protein R6L23_09605 [Streptomyces sp. SR27]|uniref:hypothetical protein n=1 Tax=Streptomyces sp. SR27 TaxID=3076630 RepID=UPI00295AEAF5|nr:hypothetical protein [Streptomyces sp. SR27]MDV9188466.1 hypothetical protein [Streptomyces sp. SR27]